MSAARVDRFRLYIAGDTPNSSNALANLTAFCNDQLQRRLEIEVADVQTVVLALNLDALIA